MSGNMFARAEDSPTITPQGPSQSYLSQQQKPGWLDDLRAWYQDWVENRKDREAAKEAGIGLTPDWADMAEAGAAGFAAGALPAGLVLAPGPTIAGLAAGVAAEPYGGKAGRALSEEFAPGTGDTGESIGRLVANLGAGAAVGGGAMSLQRALTPKGPVWARSGRPVDTSVSRRVAMSAQGPLDARVPAPERPPLPEGPIGFELPNPGPRLQVTEGPEIPANIRNLERPLKVSDIQRELGGLPPEGPSNIPEMADRPISSREVTGLLEKWKEFNPDVPAWMDEDTGSVSIPDDLNFNWDSVGAPESPNGAPIRLTSEPTADPGSVYDAAERLIWNTREPAARLMGEPSVANTWVGKLRPDGYLIGQNSGKKISFDPEALASVRVKGAPAGETSLRTRLSEIVAHEFGHGGDQGPGGTAALHEPTTRRNAGLGEHYQDIDVYDPYTLKPEGLTRFPGDEPAMTLDLTPEEYAGLPEASRRQFSLGHEAEPVAPSQMVQRPGARIADEYDARAASGSANEHLFQTRSEAVRNDPVFQRELDTIVEKFANRVGEEAPSSLAARRDLPPVEPLPDLVNAIGAKRPRPPSEPGGDFFSNPGKIYDIVAADDGAEIVSTGRLLNGMSQDVQVKTPDGRIETRTYSIFGNRVR